jgi:hypothetical protein
MEPILCFNGTNKNYVPIIHSRIRLKSFSLKFWPKLFRNLYPEVTRLISCSCSWIQALMQAWKTAVEPLLFMLLRPVIPQLQ